MQKKAGAYDKRQERTQYYVKTTLIVTATKFSNF